MIDELEQFYEAVGRDSEPSPVPDDVHHVRIDNAAHFPQGPIRAWAVNGERYWGISESLSAIPPGCYNGGFSPQTGVYLERQPLTTDNLIELPDSKSEEIIAEIEQFTHLRPAFQTRGLLFKRGVLLWGPPGSGKTSTLHLLMRMIVDRNKGVALLVQDPGVATAALALIRKVEPLRQIIAIMEDVDGLIQHHGVEQYLSLLDGESQIDNVVFVATTNFPERLDKRLTDRPSRFDTIQFIGMPSPAARYAYLRYKEPDLPEVDICQMVDLTEGLSVAHLREMIVLTQCFGRSIAASATRLHASRARPPRSDRAPDRGQVGFEATPATSNLPAIFTHRVR